MDKFIEAAKLIDSGEVYYTSTALFMSCVSDMKRVAFFDIFSPHFMECKADRVIALLLASVMAATGDLK